MTGRLAGLALLVSVSLQAQEVTTPAEAVARLRTGYATIDFADAVAAGKEHMARFPGALDVRAWTLVNQLELERAAGLDTARALSREHPESPWSWFVLTGPSRDLDRMSEREAASVKMMEFAKGDLRDDFVIARAYVIADRRSQIPEAVALLDARLPSAERRADILVAKAFLLAAQGQLVPESLERGLAVFAEAREADPTHAAAHYQEGRALAELRRDPKGLPLLRRAVELAPRSLYCRRAYWRAVPLLPNRTVEQTRQEIDADIAALLALRSDSVALGQVMLQYYDMGDTAKGDELEARILREFPQSRAADSVMRYRPYRLAQRGGAKWAENPALKAEVLAAWRAYIAYPYHPDPDQVRKAWSSLLHATGQDPATPDAEILAAVRGLDGLVEGRFSAYLTAAFVLAERRLALDEAESLARRALAELPREVAKPELYSNRPEEIAELQARTKATAHDTLGWVLLARGRRDEARKELLAAQEAYPKAPGVLFHLGRLAEEAGELAEAEGYYVRGKLLPMPEKNPNDEALEKLYQKRHGALDGYEAYVASLDQGDQAKRKTAVLAERIASPEPLPGFTLKTLSGATMSQADLQGKVAVIHFWGVWCSWCLLEMADVDALAKRYADDPGVLVLTVNNDPKVETPRKWLAEKKYGFPVLLDDGYGPKGGVVTYPTTWYVGRDGRVAFKHSGWSQKLAEESGWRIEALRGEAPAAASAGR